MLQDIRNNAQNWVAKTIVGLLVVSFALWGIHSIIGSFSSQPAVAKVNGQDITQQKFQETVQLQKQRELSQMQNPDPASIDMGKLKKQVLNGLIRQAALYQDAQSQGLALTKSDLDNIITSLPQFQQDGKFSQQAFMDTVRNMGMSVGGFRDLVRRQYLINEIRTGIMASSFTTASEVKDLLRLQKQQRSFAVLALPLSLIQGQVKVSESDIKQYYDQHKSDFVKPESVDAAYIELSAKNLMDQVNVTDKELRAQYEQKMAGYKAHEERKAAHILIQDKGPQKQVQAKLKMIEKKLAAGEDFAKLAKKYSDDVASAKQGGDLGFAPDGTYSPAFEKALDQLKPGEVTKKPVHTQYGYHFIKLLAVRKEPKPTFASMKSKLHDEIAKKKADKLFAKKLATLKDKAFTAYDLQEPAKDLGLQIQVVKGVTKQGGAAPFNHPGLVKAVFSDDVLNNGNNSDVIHLGDNDVVVARVRHHYPQSQQPLAKVKDQIKAKVQKREARTLLEKKANALAARISSGTGLEQVAASVNQKWDEHDGITRNSSDVDKGVLEKAFGMPRPDNKSKPTLATLDTDKGVDLIALKKVVEPDLSDMQKQEQQYRGFLDRAQGQKEYMDYTNEVQDNAKVERY